MAAVGFLSFYPTDQRDRRDTKQNLPVRSLSPRSLILARLQVLMIQARNGGQGIWCYRRRQPYLERVSSSKPSTPFEALQPVDSISGLSEAAGAIVV